MRTYKELLILLKETMIDEPFFIEGLCYTVSSLRHYKEMINYAEQRKLELYIKRNRPKRGKLYNKDFKLSGNYWERGQKAPRLNWIDHHIKKLSK